MQTTNYSSKYDVCSSNGPRAGLRSAVSTTYNINLSQSLKKYPDLGFGGGGRGMVVGRPGTGGVGYRLTRKCVSACASGLLDPREQGR